MPYGSVDYAADMEILAKGAKTTSCVLYVLVGGDSRRHPHRGNRKIHYAEYAEGIASSGQKQ